MDLMGDSSSREKIKPQINFPISEVTIKVNGTPTIAYTTKNILPTEVNGVTNPNPTGITVVDAMSKADIGFQDPT